MDAGDRRGTGDRKGAANAVEVDRAAGRSCRARIVELDVERAALVDIDDLAAARLADVRHGERADRAGAVGDAGAGGGADIEARQGVVGRQLDAVITGADRGDGRTAGAGFDQVAADNQVLAAADQGRAG